MGNDIGELNTLIGLRSMRKRVWVPSDDPKRPFQEIKDGAVPMWYIKERIQKLLRARETK